MSERGDSRQALDGEAVPVEVQNRTIVRVQQGSDEWHAMRRVAFSASNAPAMMGVSPYRSRKKLLDWYRTGEDEEVSQYQAALFKRGHEAEAKARVALEEDLGIELFPVVMLATVNNLKLLASMDGLSMDGKIGFEHKLLTDKLREELACGRIPEHHRWQMDQQILVTGCEYVIYVASDGQASISTRYKPDWRRITTLVNQWLRFADDLAQSKEQLAQQSSPDIALPTEITGHGTIDLTGARADAERVIAAVREIRAPVTLADRDTAHSNIDKLKKLENAAAQLFDAACGQITGLPELRGLCDAVASAARTARLNIAHENDGILQSAKRRAVTEAIRLMAQSHNATSKTEVALLGREPVHEEILAMLGQPRTESGISRASHEAAAKWRTTISELAQRIDALDECKRAIMLRAASDHWHINELQKLLEIVS
jgi:putative phage-type endonuclease